MKSKLEALLVEYGKIAVAVYLVLFLVVLAAFALALAAGFEVKSAAGAAGTLGGAYLATKLTQPVRILATLALTPAVARLIGRKKSARSPGA